MELAHTLASGMFNGPLRIVFKIPQIAWSRMGPSGREVTQSAAPDKSAPLQCVTKV